MTTPSTGDLPDVQVLNAAVIRLMSKCAQTPAAAQVQTLITLIRRLREHPDLSREPAVLAGLAEAHRTWLAVLIEPFDQETRESGADRNAVGLNGLH